MSTLVNRSLAPHKWKRRNNQIRRITRLCEGPISRSHGTNHKHITDNEGTNDGQKANLTTSITKIWYLSFECVLLSGAKLRREIGFSTIWLLSPPLDVVSVQRTRPPGRRRAVCYHRSLYLSLCTDSFHVSIVTNTNIIMINPNFIQLWVWLPCVHLDCTKSVGGKRKKSRKTKGQRKNRTQLSNYTFEKNRVLWVVQLVAAPVTGLVLTRMASERRGHFFSKHVGGACSACGLFGDWKIARCFFLGDR